MKPPLGEGEVYEANVQDLRPSLNWSALHGWTIPTSEVVLFVFIITLNWSYFLIGVGHLYYEVILYWLLLKVLLLLESLSYDTIQR